MQHTSFQVDGVNYLIESSVPQAIWPVLVDKITKVIERIGKTTAAVCCGNTATVPLYTKINGNVFMYYLTVNPKGLTCAT